MPPELQSNQSTYRIGTQELALQQQKVLRNTYLLLALTMVPTVVGAFIGMSTGGIIMQHPIISFFVMLAILGWHPDAERNQKRSDVAPPAITIATTP